MALDSKYVTHRNQQGELYNSIAVLIEGDLEKEHARRSSTRSIPSIYAVPDKLRKLNKTAYTPRMVSIGPLHKHDLHLNGMEEHKVKYMHRLFRRTKKSHHTIEADIKHTMRKCADSMLDEVPSAKASYPGSERDFTDVQFAEMMLIDGCFILETLYGSRDWCGRIGDPILGNNLVILDITRDLVLIENQIPFSILQKLFHFTVEQIQHPGHAKKADTLTKYVLQFFGNMMNVKCKMRKNADGGDHILDLLHKCYLPSPAEPNITNIETQIDIESSKEEVCCLSHLCGANSTPQDIPTMFIKYSAIELHRAGVSFEGNKGDSLNMSFCKDYWFSWICCTPSLIPTFVLSWLFCCCGVTKFKISRLLINDLTESFLRNLIAYEQCNPHIKNHVAAYAFLMHTIISSEEDVELLVRANVVENNLSGSEDALNLFNNICKEVVLEEDDLFFSKSWKEMDSYISAFPRGNLPSKLKRNCTSLRSYYFSSRWAVISLGAAIVLFALQVLQSVYTVRS